MTDRLDLDRLSPRERYKLLTALVIPRPVAWVTSVDEGGRVNAAPYSFFNVFGQDPAIVILGLERRDGAPKDTERNIDATGAFVVNIATPDLLSEMVDSAAAYPPEVGEPDALGLPLAPSMRVAPPRLARAPVAIECERHMALSLSSERSILIGRAVAIATRPGLLDVARLRVDWGGDYPVARLFGDRYAKLEEIAPHGIPAPRAEEGEGGK